MANERTVLNIVHPYTYKQIGENCIMGPVEKYHERDKKVSTFVNSALDSGVRVLWHKMYDDNINQMMREASLHFDPLFSFLFDSRIKSFNTPKSGVPIPDTKQGKLTDEQLQMLKKIFVSSSGLKEIVNPAKNLLFIGGMLECCVSNCIGFFANNYMPNERKLLYVPELCVIHDRAYWKEIKPKLDDLNATPISYSEALSFLSQ